MARSNRSSITDEQREYLETWENIAAFQNGIIRLDVRGEEKHEVIQGVREFYITTEERMLTQSKIVDSKNDPFKNGSFRPVVVPADVTLESNPNALSDDEIVEIYQASDFAWDEWMTQIDSVATLNRMVDLAEKVEGLTFARVRAVERRLADVSPRKRLTSNDPTLQSFLDEGKAPAGREQRGMGGRSSAYRDN